MWSPDGATRTFDTATAGLPTDLPYLLQPGDPFGPYTIVRPLGKGGMGQVYEAEENDSGRRVAIKLLSRGLGDDEERERFLSEGRTAASLSHPHTVYVFGTSEVQGFPVISMALAPGGTLKERVVDGSPMTPAAAVDAILQIIAGLDAAAAIGILHRDVKPSNCFLDGGGRVLVGDFGLSIDTAKRLDGTGMLAGTPGFASPEQMRGDGLDVRSDIYSVGATLYYLLTARPPFEDTDVTRLTARMAVELPSPVGSLRRDLPKELGAIVMRSLARTPGERYPDYRSLAAALEPFRTTTLRAAPLGRRFVAGIVDTYASGLLFAPLSMYFGARFVTTGDTQSFLLQSLPALLTVALYYGWLEGRWGAGAGKALVGLRVAGPAGARAGYGRALARAAVFVLPAHAISQAIQFWFITAGNVSGPQFRIGSSSSGVRIGQSEDTFWTALSIVSSLVCFLLLFCTMRRRNGFAGVHDLASGTRVVVRARAVEARQTDAALARTPMPALDGGRRIGPYVVTGKMPASLPATVEAFDDRLRRRVWIRLHPPGTPPLAPLRRDLGRRGRTRWLAGRRAGAEVWDAYEAVDGQPLVELLSRPQPWSRVRHWLVDLGEELAAGHADGSVPPLAIEQVWIGADGHARLLDWGEGEPAADGLARSARFLWEVAARSLDPAAARDRAPLRVPLPVHARALLESFRAGAVASPAVLTEALGATVRTPAHATRLRRAMQVTVCALVPLLLPVLTLGAIVTLKRIVASDPDRFALFLALQRLTNDDVAPEPRHAFEVYVATRLRPTVEDPATWKKPFPPLGVMPGLRGAAEDALARHAGASAEERQRAEAVVTPFLEKARSAMGVMSTSAMFPVALRVAVLASYFAAIAGLIGALVARGGITLWMFGLSLVRADGQDASRLRALARAAIAWSPVLVCYLLPRQSLLAALPMSVLLLGAVWAAWRPSSSIQDRLAGTRIVPR